MGLWCCSHKTAPIDPQTIDARWMITPERAKHTVVMTTQRGVRTCLNPTLSQQFPTNDQMLWCKHVLHTIISDTLFAGSVSQQGNKMAQAYATSFGWAHAQPMKCKGDAHETLSLVFQCNGVPPTMVTNDFKGQTKGEFCRKLKGGWLLPTSNWTPFPLAASRWRLHSWIKKGILTSEVALCPLLPWYCVKLSRNVWFRDV